MILSNQEICLHKTSQIRNMRFSTRICGSLRPGSNLPTIISSDRTLNFHLSNPNNPRFEQKQTQKSTSSTTRPELSSPPFHQSTNLTIPALYPHPSIHHSLTEYIYNLSLHPRPPLFAPRISKTYQITHTSPNPSRVPSLHTCFYPCDLSYPVRQGKLNALNATSL